MQVKLSSLFIIVVISEVVQALTCPESQNYAKITKITKLMAVEESFRVLSGTTVLYTSPSLEDNSQRVLEICLEKTFNSQYRLQMNDSGGDSWSDGAWISIEGINGNTVFKQMMSAVTSEEYPFSLHYPITKNSTWKYTNNAVGSWTDVMYNEQGWTEITSGTTAQTAVGTQYFRHSFAGLAEFAAIEVQLKYRYGVIAYINGIEIFRDNMPEGVVSSGTLATGYYNSTSFHGIIRSADVAEQPSSVLAVEVHFNQTSHEEVIQFNGFLSMLVGIASSNKCFVLPQDSVIATSSFFSNPKNALDWGRASYSYTTMDNSYFTVDFSTVPARAYVNGFRLWPFTSPASSLNMFSVSGAHINSGPYEEIISITNSVYSSNTWKQWVRVTPVDCYSYLRITNMAALAVTMSIYEFQFLVCNTPPPSSITYSQSKTSFFRYYDVVNVMPDYYGFSSCSLQPSLPVGLTWNTTTCSVSGVANETSAQQIYTVSAMAGTIQVTGTFTLAITDCVGSMYKIVRAYKSLPEDEYFRFYDTSNMAVIYEVALGHSHPANKDWEHYLCIVQERFDVVFYHTSNYWSSNSYFYLYYMLPDLEEELVVKGRYDNMENVINNYYLRRPVVEHSQQWYYKFDSVPVDWYSSDTTGWAQAARGSFPTATNRTQLFKKTFSVNNINDVKGYILSIRYKFGCVVYLNGQEAFRNGVVGNVTSNPSSKNIYPDLIYRVVTLPGKTIPTAEQPIPITYLQQGLNTIAIALVSINDNPAVVEFDCVVRLMTADQPESHLWVFKTGKMQNIYGNYADPFSQQYQRVISSQNSTACPPNYIEITLADDRREWVSSMHIQSSINKLTYDDPTQLKVYGRNSGDSDWTLLKEVTNLTWSIPGQKHKIYFQNNKSYNRFKFEDIFPANFTMSCRWRLQSLDLYADNMLAELAPLTYPESVEVFKDVEISEIIPEGEGYYDFTVDPPLPDGLVLDHQNGMISGTASTVSTATQTYTITANKITGGNVTTTIGIAVSICAGGRSLMTARFRADAFMNENSWKLYQGRGTSGTVLQQVSEFPIASNYYYVDFCLECGIYTLESQDLYGDGWQPNTGYTLTADVGAMELEIQEVPSGTAPVKVSSVFSTYFPFQVSHSDWKVNQSGFVEGWTAVAFDDSTWTTRKASEIPTTEQITTYIRKTFTLTNVADYEVLNIRLIYSGGVACYFNGNLVALINLDDDFDMNTESIDVHDPDKDAKFHIILPTAGVVEGLNTIAFEVHRPKSTTSAEPVVFDATGVFGVDDCSVVVDSFSRLFASIVTTGNVQGIMDLDPHTTGEPTNTIGNYIEWVVDNRLGSKWNKLNIYTADDILSMGFSISSNANPDDPSSENMILFQKTGITFNSRTRPDFDIPVALAGFRLYRWEITVLAAPNRYDINSMFMMYCKASGAVCPAIGNYPSVVEGQISPSSCPEGYKGYSYRECIGGVLGEIKMDKCALKAPSKAQYSHSRYQFVKDIKASTGLPTVRGIVTKWYIDTGVLLPQGLTLNEQTGEISGIPPSTQDITSYTIYAENSSGTTSAVVTLHVRVGQCPAEGVFPVTEVDQIAVYQCSTKKGYVGTQKRACKLGDVDGEWEMTIGLCMTIPVAVILILLVIFVCISIVFVILRTTRKAKKVGGVKGKKTVKSVTSAKTAKSTTHRMVNKNPKI